MYQSHYILIKEARETGGQVHKGVSSKTLFFHEDQHAYQTGKLVESALPSVMTLLKVSWNEKVYMFISECGGCFQLRLQAAIRKVVETYYIKKSTDLDMNGAHGWQSRRDALSTEFHFLFCRAGLWTVCFESLIGRVSNDLEIWVRGFFEKVLVDLVQGASSLRIDGAMKKH